MFAQMDKKRQLVEDLLAHLEGSQGKELGDMIEAKKNPLGDSMDKPKGLSIEKVEVMKPKEEGEDGTDFNDQANEAIKGIGAGPEEGSPEEEAGESPALESAEDKGDDEKLSDEELAELLKHYLG